MKKKLGVIFLSLVLILIITAAILIGPYFLSVQHFDANPTKGYHADFYLYVSPKARQIATSGNTATLLIQPNNSGNSDDPEFHRKDACWMGFGRHSLAKDLGVILLVPAFVRPSQDWHIYTHALDRDVFTTEREDLSRVDLQLLAMVEAARSALESEGIATNEKFLIQGYSASGMFVNRFATLHPQSVMAVAAGSPGGWPIAPVVHYEGDSLPYPAGIADLEELTGSPFDTIHYRNMPQLMVMGSLDDNDSLDFGDGWEEDNAAKVKRLFGPTPVSRWGGAEEMYKLGGANAQFKFVEGVGHDRRALQYLTTEFFREILAAQAGGQS
jgi:pimeloyl-ACP methyl ester carboxylesterase